MVYRTKKNSPSKDKLFFLVHPVRFERTALCSEDKCSNPLSYGCIAVIVPFISVLGYN